jgi:5-methylcytosine-specific restriction endonuclease McrA
MMTTAVLFLDAEWRPLRVEGWQRAITDLFNKKVQVVEYSRDRTIRGVTMDYPLPSVVRVLTKFDRKRIRLKFSRLNIYTRDKFRCQYCGNKFFSEELNLDHVIPRAQGGKTTWENVVCSCIECNHLKANQTPQQAGLKLLSQPVKPAFLPTITVTMRTGDVPPEWAPYWTGSLDR